MIATPLNELIEFINEEITERRDYSASRMCEIIRLKIETELLHQEKQIIICAWIDGKENNKFGDNVFSDSEIYYNKKFLI